MVGIGDMVWHKPWLDLIISRHDIALMAKPSAQAAAVMMDHPDLVHVSLHRAERGQKSHHDGVAGFFRMVQAMRGVDADEVWILHKSWRYVAAALLAGIPRRAGYGFGKQKYALNLGIPLPKHFSTAHPRETVAVFCDQFGLRPDDLHPKITPDQSSRKKAKTLVPDTPFIVMGVGAADAIRCWSPQRFAGLIHRLHRSHPDVLVVLCGSHAEASIGDAILAALPQQVAPPQLMFNQKVKTVIAVHEKAMLYIGNDTSLINIAAAVGIPAIRIFASSSPVLNSPKIETFLPNDLVRIDQPGAIDDIDDAKVHVAACRYL
jgi:heptosyltransferase-2